ncbi:MAG TPA: BON domain-containing protein [Chitinophagaceae bacterium]
MAEYNRKRDNQSPYWDSDRRRQEAQRSRPHQGNYGGAYGQSSYGSDSEWDRDEYRQGRIWDREHHLPGDREARRDQQGRSYGVGKARNPYDDVARREASGSSYYDDRQPGRGRSGGDRDWWDRGRDEVASWLGDEDAEHRRRLDEERTGGPHRGKGPKGYRRSEERIREDACDRLTEDDYVDATDIQVQLEGEDVVLSGTVHSRAEKRRAEDLVERVSGVRNVENRLRVEQDQSHGSTGYERDQM